MEELEIGDRGQVHIIGRDWGNNRPRSHVWLYTHWGCYKMIDDVRAALELAAPKDNPYSGRWGDDEYLSRIVFCRIIDGDTGGVTGYGICGKEDGQHGDVYRTVTLDTETKMVTVRCSDEIRFHGTFEEFVDTRPGSIQWYDDD